MSENGREEAEVTDWQQIGQVAVDSGQLALVDPHYVDAVDGYVMESYLIFDSVTTESGAPLAVVVGSGFGDGIYPVEARFESVAGDVRLAEVRVVLIPEPEDAG